MYKGLIKLNSNLIVSFIFAILDTKEHGLNCLHWKASMEHIYGFQCYMTNGRKVRDQSYDILTSVPVNGLTSVTAGDSGIVR